MKRRSVIKAIGAVGSLAGLGVFMPNVVRAAWPEQAFAAADQSTALEALFGGVPEESLEVTLKAPDIVEDSSIVPITVATSLEAVESISLLVAGAAQPLVAQFIIPIGTEAEVGTRIRMQQTAQVIAVVKTADRVFSAAKEVKVTHCGCQRSLPGEKG